MNLEGLNEVQKKAVTKTEGPLLVLAGAGSGKTRVLTTRIAYMIKELGIDPYNILAITFTNKAAKEMKERIINLIGPSAYEMQISTFHSFGLSIIKENYEKLEYKKNFTIFDSDDSLSVVKKIIKEMNLDPKQYNPRGIKSKISSAKNELITPEEYEKFVTNEYEELVYKVYKSYQKKLKVNNSFDFDDLLIMPIKLFNENKEVLKNYQERFNYVLIDEYQDTNEAQYILTKMISAKYKNICVVGDENQSIYSFRGSNYRNILNFEKDYANSEVIMLEENYRSTKNILEAANAVIKNNKQRKDKKLWTRQDEGVKIKYKRLVDEKDEAFFVKAKIKSLLEDGVTRNNIAILYRTNAQSRNIEEVLLAENIPYKVVGGFYFYQRKEIKDLIAYLKLIHNSNDDISLQRIINVPKRKIGLKTIQKIQSRANDLNSSLFDSIESGKELEFKKIINDIIAKKPKLSITELVEEVLDKSGMRQELKNEKTLDAEIRIENLEEFKSITKSFEERYGTIMLDEFLEEISLVADIEEYKDKRDVVTLMTVHSAKGLEFDYVFVIGLEETIFPHKNSLMDNEQLEEERRLCYVAITRAKKELFLLNAKRRRIFGMDTYSPQSRFIEEIGDEFLESLNSENDVSISNARNIDSSIEYKIGDNVTHITFGEGIVVAINKSILSIAFPHPYGVKSIMKGHKSIRKE